MIRARRTAKAFVAAVISIGVALTGGGLAHAEPAKLPVVWDLSVAALRTLDATNPPPGANEWHCKPSAQHPRAVVLVNPTGSTQGNAFYAGAPFLKNNGFCVFTFNYGNVTPVDQAPIQALGSIPNSAKTLAGFVDKVLASTGTSQVDLVGHSQGGGILPDYYLKFLGGGSKVHTKVGISPSTGTTLDEFVFFRSLIPVLGPAVYNGLDATLPALIQQVYDSPVNQRTYGPGNTPPDVNTDVLPAGVHYDAIITRYDEVVTPFTMQFYRGHNASNVVLQDRCNLDMSEHISTLYSERAWLYALNALNGDLLATPVPCFYVAPFLPYVR